RAGEWFELDRPSPYMLLTAPVRAGVSAIPAVTHVDGSARVQTVHRELHPRFHALLAAFERLTGCPVLVNTSFNVRDEPIVESPADAWRCFMGTALDALVVEDCLVEKRDQPSGTETSGAHGAAPRLPWLVRARRAWLAVGGALGRANARVLLGIVYAAMVVPMGLALRAFGRDPLARALEPGASTYRRPARTRPRGHVERTF
ncbi:MAG: SxtJ family membrane protein, partial [bacterium]